jgi:hypothetical protein
VLVAAIRSGAGKNIGIYVFIRKSKLVSLPRKSQTANHNFQEHSQHRLTSEPFPHPKMQVVCRLQFVPETRSTMPELQILVQSKPTVYSAPKYQLSSRYTIEQERNGRDVTYLWRMNIAAMGRAVAIVSMDRQLGGHNKGYNIWRLPAKFSINIAWNQHLIRIMKETSERSKWIHTFIGFLGRWCVRENL